MELKPAKGIKVKVGTKREAIFGDEALTVQRISIPEANAAGVMTGATLAGYCEVAMPSLDGKKHWYPISDLVGENGETIVEEEIPIDLTDDEEGSPEEDDGR
jgi:hypothetical protein